ncbi:MAG: tetratricopeptide repeat protein [Tidjanibacter sp.]|nr:tetratricopeptide repeat protein [Tidjanibacter sp.]
MIRKIFSTIMLLSLSVVAWGGNDDYKDSFARGESLMRAGKYEAAHFEFSRAAARATDQQALSEAEFYAVLCESYVGDATEALTSYLNNYPASVFADRAMMALAGEYFENRYYGEALNYYFALRPTRLTVEEQEEYDFKLGYCIFMDNEYDAARTHLGRITSGEYLPHTEYVLGYMAYNEGDMATAEEYFLHLIDHPDYSTIIPIYLLYIEYSKGNYHYVSEHVDRLLAEVSGNSRAEMVRMAAESRFRIGEWISTSRYMTEYESSGGEMGREELYLRGFSEYMLAEYELAEKYLSRVCGPDDRLTQNASYHLGDCYLRSGDKTKAMQSFAMAAASNFDEEITEDALFNYGKLQFELGGGYFNEAVNVLTRYMEQYPNSERTAEVEEYLVASYFNSRNYDAAYDAIKRMPSPDRNIRAALQKIVYFRAVEAYNRGDMTAAKRLFEEADDLRYNARYTALTSYWMGEVLYRLGDYGGATKKWEQYIKLSPSTERENRMARYNIGYSYFNAGNMSSARKWFDDFLALYSEKDSYRADALNRRGDVEAAGRSFWRAIEYYDKAVALRTKEQYYATYQRAMMLGMVDRPERKVETLREIIAAGAGDWVDDAMYELGRTHILNQNYSAAATALEEFVKCFPNSPNYLAALSDLGLAYQNTGNDDKALTYYKQVVESSYRGAQSDAAMAGIRSIYVNKNDVNSYFDYAEQVGIATDLGEVQRDSLAFTAARNIYIDGDKNRAAAALTEYVKNYPAGAYVAAALYYGGDCSASLGDNGSAVAKLSQLLRMNANDYSLMGARRLAPLAYRVGEYRTAVEAYDKVSKLSNDNSERQEALEGMIRGARAVGDNEFVVSVADDVASRASASPAVIRQAEFAKAVALDSAGRGEVANPIFEKLSADVSDAAGAESAYRVIEHKYKTGDMVGAEEAVYAFADKNTPHSYWLGKAFLTLGDIYVSIGDSFQARATYQSIVDGYGNSNDGIVDEAQERIKKLK